MTRHPTHFVCVGAITAAHGVRGQVKIKPFTAEPESLLDYGTLFSEDGKTAYPITIISQSKGQFIAEIEGVSDRNAAEQLRGTKLYIDRDQLPDLDENEFYYEDLIGMRVVDAQGADFGVVRQVSNHGAGDLLEIALTQGGSRDYLFSRANFPEIDVRARRIVIIPPEEVEAKE